MEDETVGNMLISIMRGVRKENALPTLTISKRVFGPKATCGQINPFLYAFKTRGMMDRLSESNGSRPRWYCTWISEELEEESEEERKDPFYLGSDIRGEEEEEEGEEEEEAGRKQKMEEDTSRDEKIKREWFIDHRKEIGSRNK